MITDTLCACGCSEPAAPGKKYKDNKHGNLYRTRRWQINNPEKYNERARLWAQKNRTKKQAGEVKEQPADPEKHKCVYVQYQKHSKPVCFKCYFEKQDISRKSVPVTDESQRERARKTNQNRKVTQ
jgi:hypothetical protein